MLFMSINGDSGINTSSDLDSSHGVLYSTLNRGPL